MAFGSLIKGAKNSIETFNKIGVNPWIAIC